MGWWSREQEEVGRERGPWRRAASGALRGLALAAPALLYPLIWYADAFRRPLRTTPIFLGLLVLALIFGRRETTRLASGTTDGAGWWARGEDRWGLRLVAVGTLGLLWLLMAKDSYQGLIMYAVRSTGSWIAVGCVIGGLTLILLRPPRPWVVLIALVAGDLSLRAFFAREWPIEPWVGDMLPLVQSACDRFLSGLDPYAVHQMQIDSQVPLTYPPGMWLTFLPARALGVDIRWTSWVADAVVASCLAWPALRAAMRPRSGRPALAAPMWPVLLSAAAYLFIIDTHWNGIFAEPHVDWAATALLACAIASRRPIATGLALGYALAVRPLNLPLAPLVAVGLWRLYGLRRAAQSLLAGAAVTLAFYLPFVLWNPDTFFLGTVRWLFEYSRVHAAWFHDMMGFAGPLLESHHEGWLHPLQLVAVALGVAWTAWRVRTPRGLLTACALVYFGVVAFNPLIWMSFWIGAAIWVAAAVGCPMDDPAREEQEDGSAGDGREGSAAREGRRVRAFLADARVLVAGGVVAAALGGWMVVLLSRHFSTEGREEVRAALRQRVRPGDLVVDRTGWRFAFLQTPPILGPEEVPRGVWLATNAYSAMAPEVRGVQPGPSLRVLAVDRYGLFDIDRPAFAGIYQTTGVERFGLYRLTTLERVVQGHPIRLVDRLATARVELDEPGGRLSATWATEPPRWTFPGVEEWQDVRVTACRYHGRQVGAVWMHPPAKGWVVLTMPIPPAATWVLVSAGLVDGAPEFGRAEVLVDVRSGEGGPTRLTFPNEPGRFGRTVRLPPGHGERLELAVGAADNSRRHFCLDATVW